MNYFQIAIDPKEVSESVLNQCLQDIEISEIEIERKEKFDENYPLKGYNIYLKDVDEKLMSKWTKIISKVVKNYKEVSFRFRLKGWTY